MFGKKKTSNEESLPLTPKGGLKKVDTIVTGILLGGVLASIYGIKRKNAKKNQSVSENQDQLSLFEEPKKSFLMRIFSRKNKS